MDLQKRNWQREQDAAKTAIGELAFLCGWVMQYPQHAAQLALDAHELARRYVEDPTPDIEIRAMISQETWKKFIATCSAAQGVSLNDEACMEIAVDILNKGIQGFIEQQGQDGFRSVT